MPAHLPTSALALLWVMAQEQVNRPYIRVAFTGGDFGLSALIGAGR